MLLLDVAALNVRTVAELARVLEERLAAVAAFGWLRDVLRRRGAGDWVGTSSRLRQL